MANDVWAVLYNRVPIRGLTSGTPALDPRNLTKAQSEENAKLGKEPNTLESDVEQCLFVRILSENEKTAAQAARVMLGATGDEKEFLVVKDSNLKLNPTR